MPYIPPPSWDSLPKLKRSKRFESIASEALELKQKIRAAKTELEALEQNFKDLCEDMLEPELIAGGVRENVTIEYEGAQIRIADQGSGSTINEKKLLELGVPKSKIEAAKVPNKRKHYIDIRFPGDAVGEGGAEVIPMHPRKTAAGGRRS